MKFMMLSLLRTGFKGNTFCACRKILIDRQNNDFVRACHILSQIRRNFSSNVVLGCISSRKSGKIEDITVKETIINTLVDPTGTGRDLTGDLDQDQVSQTLMSFTKQSEVYKAAQMEGLIEPFLSKAMERFTEFVMNNISQLPAQLHIVLYDIINSGKHMDDLFPFFIDYAKKLYPHFEFKDDLQLICDLTQPANWYPEARRMKRKIIFHSGPTNSGKTYHALKAFMNADTGVYCGPLRLLAVEVFKKCQDYDVPCDLITGEERRFHFSPDEPAAHISSTVEMASTTLEYDVAVIDEIQMLRDQERGGAWTRVLLGLCAREIHLCGEEAAVNLVQRIVHTTGDSLEVRRYDRLTKLRFDTKAIETLEEVQGGDCLVCFQKKTIYNVCMELERLGHNVAVIYGSLPPATKLAQAEKFNDPKDPCKVLVATDAIGMGINLTPQAKQIAGRAGRYGAGQEVGLVTAFTEKRMLELKDIIKQEVEDIKAAGLLPTVEQLEQFYFYLPSFKLPDILNIFEHMSTVNNDMYFLCAMQNFKALASLIDHIDLPLRVRYQFCMAPVSLNSPSLSTMYAKFARSYSNGTPIDCKWLLMQTDYPWVLPRTIKSLSNLEEVYEIMDMYLWLSFRFEDIFCDREKVQEVQSELETVVQEGVKKLGLLLLKKKTDETKGLSQKKFKWKKKGK